MTREVVLLLARVKQGCESTPRTTWPDMEGGWFLKIRDVLSNESRRMGR